MNKNIKAITVNHVGLSYNQGPNQLLVLDDVSFTVFSGEIAVFAGDNGVGKSSLLNILAGTVTPTKGGVQVLGKSPRQANIGIVWQNTYASLYPWLTASENAALPLRLRGMGRNERQQKIHEMNEELGFALPLERRPYELSGGEQQKVSILRALASNCELLMMDEPFSNLSFDSSMDLLMHIQQIHMRTNLTTVIVSHLLEFSIFVADVIIPLRQKPVRLKETDRIKINPPCLGYRPRSWMFEPNFRSQVEELKNILGSN